MKIIYAGTPEFSVPALEMLAQSDHQVVAVYTQPDRPAGRGRKLQASPVKQCAARFDLPVRQPSTLRDDSAIDELRELDADLMVVAAYGLILPQAVLDAPRLGCVNIHASLLPRWRGAAPIQRAILAGDRETGITLMQMEAGLDTGPMLATSRIAIDDEMSAASLHDSLSQMGADLLQRNLADIEGQRLEPQQQDDSVATYAEKLTKSEAEIDWNSPAAFLQRQIRAFNPWPVSFTSLDGANVKIWVASSVAGACSATPGTVLAHDRDAIRVCTGEGQLLIREIQFAGRTRQSASQLLNSRDLVGECFGASTSA
jgi:methionyl-tRNA formyltransferase